MTHNCTDNYGIFPVKIKGRFFRGWRVKPAMTGFQSSFFSKKMSLLLLVIIAFAFHGKLNAQQDLHINKVFEQYGKKKGVVMVQMSGEMLKGYDFSLFKSIVIKNDNEATVFIRKCIEKDQEGAKKIKQVVQNGEVTSIVLQLTPRGKENRLILYNESADEKKELTLIYIESKKDADKIINTILKKK